MSMSTALAELRSANITLQQSIAELVITMHEDGPQESDLAVVDNARECALEVQAAAAEAGAVIGAIAEARGLPAAMPHVSGAISQCTLRYWRDVRGYKPVSQLRATARGRGMEWRTWQRSVEQSALRCEAELQRSTDSVHAAWQEISELLALYLPGPPADEGRQSPETLARASAPAAPKVQGGHRE
ncbi:MAG: hypothetical protein QOF88_6806 [Mycobacterium sp.]|jgi:hypothetical protein|nr:hypothetical protein [Pseudonocardiales bacterium]MDT5291917.1 hypothetical protein [Mycobacterium sp.]